MEPKFPESWAGLKFPQWRCELLQTLKELADPIYQQKAWIEQSVDKQVIVGARQAYHSLFDDLDLGEAPQRAVGCFLLDNGEAQALAPLIALLAAIRAEVGEPESAACLAHPRWPEVVGLAAAARARLLEKGEPALRA